MKHGLILLSVLMAISASLVSAQTTIVVTPGNPGGWTIANVQAGGTSEITATQPRSGSGSLEQYIPVTTGSPSPKVDHALVQDLGRLSDLTNLSFDWRRASGSTAAGHLTPGFRVLVEDPNYQTQTGTVTASFLMIWEGVYNGYPIASGSVPTDVWVPQDVVNGYFWRVPQYVNGVWKGMSACNQAGDPYQCFTYNRTLQGWNFSPDTRIKGIVIGLGSGWTGDYRGFIDNVKIGFSNATTTYNFELPPAYTCAGFAPPFANPITLKKGNKSIPLRIALTTAEGVPVTDQFLAAMGAGVPVINVLMQGSAINPVPTADIDLLSAGQANDGNQMRFDAASGMWIYNLSTKLFTAEGVYAVKVGSGGAGYSVAPTCTQTFTIAP